MFICFKAAAIHMSGWLAYCQGQEAHNWLNYISLRVTGYVIKKHCSPLLQLCISSLCAIRVQDNLSSSVSLFIEFEDIYAQGSPIHITWDSVTFDKHIVIPKASYLLMLKVKTYCMNITTCSLTFVAKHCYYNEMTVLHFSFLHLMLGLISSTLQYKTNAVSLFTRLFAWEM